MRVVHVVPSLHGGGGAERSLASVAPYLCQSINLVVVTLTPRLDLKSQLEEAGAVVTDLTSETRAGRLRALRALLADVSPDLVHTTLIEADLLGRSAALSLRLPVVSSLVNVNYGREHFEGDLVWRAKKAAVWAADLLSAQAVARFHAITWHVAETMSRRLAISRHRIDVIPRGRDPEQLGVRSDLRRRVVRDALGLGEAPAVFATARHERQKGLDVLLRAAPIVIRRRPDARFVIGGREGTSSESLRRLVVDLKLTDHVQMVGQRDDVPDLMTAADVWCVPSLWEGFGGILIEAMALGVPVVASEIAPIVEVARGRSCFALVPPGNPQALAEEILSVLDNPARSEERAAAGRRLFLEHYTSEQVAAQTLEFYKRAVSGPHRVARRSGRISRT